MQKITNSRLKEFQRLIAREGLDGYVVTRVVDMGFLTGYNLEGYMLLVGKTKSWAFLTRMLVEQFESINNFCSAQASADFPSDVIAKAKEQGMKKIGFDSDNETYPSGILWKKHGFKECPALLKPIREIKRPEEIAKLRKSCHIAAKTFEIVRPKIKPGMTEAEVARMLEDTMKSMGAKGTSFDTIVGSGPNSALPHHVTGQRKIRKGEPLLLDFGCIYEDYCSDITRTIFIGKPTPLFREIYSIVDMSQKAGVKAAKAGVKTFDVDKICRDLIAKMGYGDKFIHGTGHGVGLEIHEPPRLNTVCPAVLRETMAVTIEPGIYLHGKFGVRIEDTVLIKKNGCEILTK